jgi:hypothetical protein
VRNRARYETANNSYARGIVLTLANDVVGTGPELQLATNDADANSPDRTGVHDLGQGSPPGREAPHDADGPRPRTAKRSRSSPATRDLPTEIQLDVRLIKADQVATSDLLPLSPTAVDGIVFDAFGNPQEYHVLKRHPGDRPPVLAASSIRCPLTRCCTGSTGRSAGTARAIPDIARGMPLFAAIATLYAGGARRR